jgi:hypothetical protein
MNKISSIGIGTCFCLTLPAIRVVAQAPEKPTPAGVWSSCVESALELAAKGHCQQALPTLKKSTSRIHDKDLKYRAAMATARCAMSLDQEETAVQALWMLSREFPGDPEALYIATHYYSRLATRASQRLATTAPSSYQAHELKAEADESQGKWEDAFRAALRS